MGLLAIGNMVLAVMAAVAVYQSVCAIWRMPMVMNLPGAFCVFTAVISLSGWLLHDLFDGYMRMPAPQVPWYAWLVHAGFAVLWYVCMIFRLNGLRCGRH